MYIACIASAHHRRGAKTTAGISGLLEVHCRLCGTRSVVWGVGGCALTLYRSKLLRHGGAISSPRKVCRRAPGWWPPEQGGRLVTNKMLRRIPTSPPSARYAPFRAPSPTLSRMKIRRPLAVGRLAVCGRGICSVLRPLIGQHSAFNGFGTFGAVRLTTHLLPAGSEPSHLRSRVQVAPKTKQQPSTYPTPWDLCTETRNLAFLTVLRVWLGRTRGSSPRGDGSKNKNAKISTQPGRKSPTLQTKNPRAHVALQQHSNKSRW